MRFVRALGLAAALGTASAGPAAAAPSAVTLDTPFAASWFVQTEGYRDLVAALKAPDPNVPEVQLTEADLKKVLPRVDVDERELKWVLKYASPLSRKRQKKRVRSVRHILLSDTRMARGADFAKTHAAVLADVSERYDVAVEDLLGMLNAESNFGKVTGSYTVLDVFFAQLAYLELAERAAFDRGDYRKPGAMRRAKNRPRIAKRRRYAIANISALLRYAKLFRQDPFTFKGSWAGAIGMTQFMPASLQWAKDGDKNGRVDLSTVPDAVESTANYLVEHGYVRGNKKARRRAFRAYNPNSEYVSAIDDYATRFARRKR